MERLRPFLFAAALLFSNAAHASPPGGKGGLTPSVPAPTAPPEHIAVGISLGDFIGILMIFGAVILLGVWFITRHRRQ